MSDDVWNGDDSRIEVDADDLLAVLATWRDFRKEPTRETTQAFVRLGNQARIWARERR